jgi:hypothetical protein
MAKAQANEACTNSDDTAATRAGNGQADGREEEPRRSDRPARALAPVPTLLHMGTEVDGRNGRRPVTTDEPRVYQLLPGSTLAVLPVGAAGAGARGGGLGGHGELELPHVERR